MNITIKTLLSLYILLFSLLTQATNCGSAPPPTLNSTIAELKQDSIYSYLIDLVSTNAPTNTDHTEVCNQKDSTMKIYLKQAQGKWQDFSLSLEDHINVNVIHGDNGDYYLSRNGSPSKGSIIVENVLLFLKTYPENGLLCLNYPTVDGPAPIICQNYLKKDDNNIRNELDAEHKNNPCFGSNNDSMFALNFSGRALHCVYDTLDSTFFSKNLSDTNLANFVDFQYSIQIAVLAGLTLYVIFFGIKLLLEPARANTSLVSGFVIKFLLVLYFTIGFNVFAWDGAKKVENGFIQYGLPFFKSASSSLASIVFDAAGAEGLCNFSDIHYKPGMDFYRIWDSLDCRLFTYLGVTPPRDADKATQDQLKNENIPKYLSNTKNQSVLGMFILLFGFFLGGNIILSIFLGIFLILFLSLIIFFVSAFLVYTITIYCMAYFAPIFIPMALFERTKGYFNGWIKLLISCSLQPAILIGFMALLLTTYDGIIYGDQCQFKAHISESLEYNVIDRFDFVTPIQTECSNSVGYKMVSYIFGDSWQKVSLIFFEVSYLPDNQNTFSGMILIMIFSCIAYFFSKIMTAFAATITGGPDIGGVAIGPTEVFDSIKEKLASKGKSPKSKESASTSSSSGKGG